MGPSPSEEWRATLERVAKRLLKQGEKRNRYVHDYWTLTSGSLERLERKAAVRKAQAFQTPKLVFDTKHVTPPGDVDQLAVDYAVTAVCLVGAMKDLEAWKRVGRLPPPSLLITTDQARTRHAKPTQPRDQ